MCLLLQQQHLKLAALLRHLALLQPVPEACTFTVTFQTACLSPMIVYTDWECRERSGCGQQKS